MNTKQDDSLWRISVQLFTTPATHNTVQASLEAIEASTRAKPGCRDWGLSQSLACPKSLLLIEEWASREAMDVHIRADEFRVVLAAFDLSCREPEISIDAIGKRAGLDYLKTLLMGRSEEPSRSRVRQP